MPMRYADEEDVLLQLRLTEESDEYDRLVRLENALCEVFDYKTGMAFGEDPNDETRTVAIANSASYPPFGVRFPYDYGYGYATPRLVLSVPLRSVTSIEWGGTWNGTTWVGGTALTTADYMLTNRTSQGYYAIDRIGSSWGGSLRITGIWADQMSEDIPLDVVEALTFLTINEWHTDNASPAGQIGPDGMFIPTRNPWNFERVKAALDRHTVVEVLI